MITSQAPTDSSTADRLEALERALHDEKRRYRELYEREVAERRHQFSRLLAEMSKAIEKMERADLRLEKDLRSELTRQNRFIYDEFQEGIRQLHASIERESGDLREAKVDRSELQAMVRSLSSVPSNRFDALLS